MNAVLIQIAVAVGFLLFLLAFGIGLLLGHSLLTVFFRSLMIMLLGTIVVTLFFRFFAQVLYRYIAEQRILEMQEAEKREAEKKQAQMKEAERKVQAQAQAQAQTPPQAAAGRAR